MPDTSTIKELIERVEKAVGPDRELDAAIVKAFCPEATVSTYIAGDDGDVVFHANELGIANKATVPLYTSSIDAAFALAERKLPGVWWHIAKGRSRPDEPLYGIVLLREGTEDDVLGEAEHECLELAIILATLRALQGSMEE